MKTLAKKLSVFALSSVILLSNSPIKARMFAEGQTYDLGKVGTVKIENYHSLGNSVESFDILGFHCEIDRGGCETFPERWELVPKHS